MKIEPTGLCHFEAREVLLINIEVPFYMHVAVYETNIDMNYLSYIYIYTGCIKSYNSMTQNHLYIYFQSFFILTHTYVSVLNQYQCI